MGTPMHVVAEGSIRPFRFVKFGTTDYSGLEADANEIPIGISAGSTRNPPLNDLVTTNNHAEAGDTVQLRGPTEQAKLELGAAVTTPGTRLKSDADGLGVPIATSGTAIQNFGAVAKQAGVTGDIIDVEVRIGSERPALT